MTRKRLTRSASRVLKDAQAGMRVQNCRSPPHPRLLRRGQIICMNRRSFTHGANENMGVPGSQPPTERLAQSQQMLNLTQKPTSQMNLSLRCIGCLLWCLTGCTLFSAQEVIHLKEAVTSRDTRRGPTTVGTPSLHEAPAEWPDGVSVSGLDEYR